MVTLLPPIYFVYSGLSTRIGLLSDSGALFVFAVILLGAVVCKVAASMLACRLGGYAWRDGASLGPLMNGRGVMELALINVGLQKGVITTALFTAGGRNDRDHTSRHSAIRAPLSAKDAHGCLRP